MWWAALLALALGVATAGCLPFTKSSPRGRDYRLAYAAPEPAGAAYPEVVHVLPFTVAAGYDSQAILYRQGEYRLGRYPHHRWAANPGNLVADLIARDLDATGMFRAVQHARPAVASDLRLAGEVDLFEEGVTREGCAARIAVRILLARIHAPPHERILLRRSYAESEPSQCEDAGALARAMSRAVERISGDLRRDIAAVLTFVPPTASGAR